MATNYMYTKSLGVQAHKIIGSPSGECCVKCLFPHKDDSGLNIDHKGLIVLLHPLKKDLKNKKKLHCIPNSIVVGVRYMVY